MPNCRYQENMDINEASVLAWNYIGTCHLKRYTNFTSVDVEFTDKTFHRDFQLNDDFTFSMACLNYSGLLLASRGEVQDDNQYEEEDLNSQTDNKKNSTLLFKPFDQLKNNESWHFQMEKGERIESIALGTQWAACYTDKNFIRLFSHEGIQKSLFFQSSMVVSMTGYENLLVVVYHAGMPLYDHQQLKFKIIDINTMKVEHDAEFPISRNSHLTWLGFSEEGMLSAMDDNGMISALNFQNHQWVPILDLKSKYQRNFRSIWIVAICEMDLLVIELPSGHKQPSAQMKSRYKRINFKVPFLKQESKPDQKEETLAQIEESVFREQQFFQHEMHRKQVWEPMKLFRGSTDNERFISESILDEKEIIQRKKNLDTKIFNAIRQSIMEEDHDKVFTYIGLLNFQQTVHLTVKLCEKLKHTQLAE